MKRSSAVQLVLITAAATAVTACNEKPTRYCVDDRDRVVDDRDCQNPHHWYFGGGHGFVPVGTVLRGGSTAQPSEGFSTADESATARGVIGEAGESAAGHGSSAGEGGGE